MSQQTTAQASGRWELGPLSHLPTLDLSRPLTAFARHPPVAAIIVRPSRDPALPPPSCRAVRLVYCAYVQVHRYISSTD